MRADLTAFLEGCPALDDLLLVADEFCVNAVMHTKSGQPDGSFDVHVHVVIEDRIRVEVLDDGGQWLEHDPDDDRPHGLNVVNALCGAGNWGIGGGPPGRVAWASLNWHGGPDSSDPEQTSEIASATN